MKKIVVYGATRNLYPVMRTAVKSLLAHNKIDCVALLIEDDSFPYEMPENVVSVNVSNQTYFPPDGANYNTQWTYITLVRCVLSKYFPEESRILWLDCDTIVVGDISELFTMDMGDNYFAGAQEHRKGDYINTGVLLMNLDAIRRDEIDNVLVCVLNHQKYELPDQDAINEIAKGRILFLDSKYNFCPFTPPPPDEPVIYHYAGRKVFDNDPLYKKYSGEQTETRTLIAVPTYGAIDPDFMKAFVDLQNPPGTTYTIIKNSLIYNARNTIAENAIRYGFDRVLWLDSDMIFAPDTLLKLAEDMEGRDYVSALYFQRKYPTNPVVYSKIYYKVKQNEAFAGAENITEYPEDIFEIAGSGFGCVMTSTLLLKRLVDRYGSPFTPMMGLGEDLAFCWRAAQNGFKMYCDGRIKCGHIGTMMYDERVWIGQKMAKEHEGLHPIAP